MPNLKKSNSKKRSIKRSQKNKQRGGETEKEIKERLKNEKRAKLVVSRIVADITAKNPDEKSSGEIFTQLLFSFENKEYLKKFKFLQEVHEDTIRETIKERNEIFPGNKIDMDFALAEIKKFIEYVSNIKQSPRMPPRM
jgi:hypothetical protein